MLVPLAVDGIRRGRPYLRSVLPIFSQTFLKGGVVQEHSKSLEMLPRGARVPGETREECEGGRVLVLASPCEESRGSQDGSSPPAKSNAEHSRQNEELVFSTGENKSSWGRSQFLTAKQGRCCSERNECRIWSLPCGSDLVFVTREQG